MYRQLPLLGAVALTLAACQTTPKQTVLDLDTTDAKWLSAECVAARKAAHEYDDKPLTRAAAGVAGTVAAGPIAGAAASTALSAGQDDEREDLNNKIKRACVSKPGDPLGDPVGDRIAASVPPPAIPAEDATAAAQPASAVEPAPLDIPPPQ
jgi:hypothetical protein